ncbi:MAG: Eco57I restriction-modification methylase domain-containing protein [Bacteroidota bacterium]
MTIKTLVDKYHSNRDNYINPKYNETLLRSDFLDPLFELLGWDIKNNAGKPTNEREVILEEALKAHVAENSKKPDYTFRLFSERKFFLEAKKPSVSVHNSNETAKQVRRYGFTAKLKISILSNFEHLLIFDTSVQVENSDTYHRALIKSYHYTEYEEAFEEIIRLIGRDSVYSGNFDAEWSSIEDKINQYSIDDLFLNQINSWRTALGEEIYKNKPEIDENQLNDIVQNYLNRIIFLRVCEDRNLEEYQTLLQLANTNDFDLLISKFEEADKKYNSGLFTQLLSHKLIKDVSSVFWDIIKQLYYPESAYSFSVFSSDILGSIYEIFLSEKLTINSGTIELVKKPENQDRDIITTPTFIINDILRNTVSKICLGKTDLEILNMKFSDISCGSGAFLLELYQFLNDILIDYYLNTAPTKLIQLSESNFKLPIEIKRQVLNCIYGVDKDFNAVEATKFGLLLKLLEGEDTASTDKVKPVLPGLDNNIFFGNSLIETRAITEKKNIKTINPFDFNDLRFDVIVGNPPYMKSEDMKNITPLELPIYKDEYVSAYKQFDKYFLFIERGLELLTEKGMLGYIVPSKFTKVGAGKELREWLTDGYYLQSIVSFGANQVFKDKTTYTCLLFLTNLEQNTFEYAEVRNLKEWKIRDSSSIDFKTNNTDDLNEDTWILIPSDLEPAYKSISTQSIKLIDLVGEENIFNGIQTSANEEYVIVPEKEDDDFYYFTKKSSGYKIEKEITKPYYKTATGQDNLYTYREFKPNSRVIYPYRINGSATELISLLEIEKKYPEAFKYLMLNEPKLNGAKRDIKPVPSNSNEWHRFGRSQGLNIVNKPEKIIVGVLSNGDKYSIDKYGTLFTSGGTAGYCAITLPDACPYSIYYLQAILNSKYVEWFVILTGEIFRGSYFARGTKVLNNLPIRQIDFSDKVQKDTHNRIANIQMILIGLQSEIDRNYGNKRIVDPLKRQFEIEKANLENELFMLYGLTVDLDKSIPTIKGLYEAN